MIFEIDWIRGGINDYENRLREFEKNVLRLKYNNLIFANFSRVFLVFSTN